MNTLSASNENIASPLKRKATPSEEESAPKRPLASVDSNVVEETNPKKRITPTVVSENIQVIPVAEEPEMATLSDEEDYADWDEDYDSQKEEEEELNTIKEEELADEVNDPLNVEEEEKQSVEFLKAKGFQSHGDVIRSVGVNSPRYQQNTVKRWMDLLSKDAAVVEDFNQLDLHVEQIYRAVEKGLTEMGKSIDCTLDLGTIQTSRAILHRFLNHVIDLCVTFSNTESPEDDENSVDEEAMEEEQPAEETTQAENEESEESDESMYIPDWAVIESLKFLGLSVIPDFQVESEFYDDHEEENSSDSESEEEEEPEMEEEEDESSHYYIEKDSFADMMEVTSTEDVAISEDSTSLIQHAAENFMMQLFSQAQSLGSFSGQENVTSKDLYKVLELWGNAPGASNLLKRMRKSN